MCGISGLVGRSLFEEAPARVRAMCAAMAHRGPDDEGMFADDFVCMGVRRLSVIDLAGGHQPIVSPDRKVCVALNGEIYNYVELNRELRERGYQFVTRGDTETLLHGYKAWGIDGLLRRLNGMFAFCVYDGAAGKVFLARDPAGEKPLYYAAGPDRFAFASELGALVAGGVVAADVNRNSLAAFLLYQYAAGTEAMLADVRRLSPGHYLTLDVHTGRVDVDPYWRPRVSQETQRDADWQRTLRERLTEAVRLRLRADVPVGAFLSGGLDSSIMAALMVASGECALHTFSIGFDEPAFDESQYSRLVAQHLGTCHHELVLSPSKAAELAPTVVHALDEPIADAAAIPTYWMCQEAKKSVTVVLTGEGADELFAGYRWYTAFSPAGPLTRLARFLRRPFSRTSAATRQSKDPISGFPIVPVDQVEPLFSEPINLRGIVASRRASIAAGWSGEASALGRAQLQDFLSWLPDDLLLKADRMSMANALEVRAPYLDRQVIEFGLTLPDAAKRRGRVVKAILRDAFADILPPSVLTRGKQGFDLPLRRWLRSEMRELVRDTLSVGAIERDRIFVASEVDQVVDDFMAGRSENGRLVYALYVFQEWHRHLTARVTSPFPQLAGMPA